MSSPSSTFQSHLLYTLCLKLAQRAQCHSLSSDSTVASTTGQRIFVLGFWRCHRSLGQNFEASFAQIWKCLQIHLLGQSHICALTRNRDRSYSSTHRVLCGGGRQALGPLRNCVALLTAGCFPTAGPSQDVLEFLRIALGIPIIVALTHPFVAGPVSNSLYYDFQSFTNQAAPSSHSAPGGADDLTFGAGAHLGCPSATMECKLIDVNEDDALSGNYRGHVSLGLI